MEVGYRNLCDAIMDHQIRNNLQLLDSILSLYMGKDAAFNRDLILSRLRRKLQIISTIYEYSRHLVSQTRLPFHSFARAIVDSVFSRLASEDPRKTPVVCKFFCPHDIEIGLSHAQNIGFLVDYMAEQAMRSNEFGTGFCPELGVRKVAHSLVIHVKGPMVAHPSEYPSEDEIITAVADRSFATFEKGCSQEGIEWLCCHIADEGYRV